MQLDRLEMIRDGLQDSDNQFGIDGSCDDITALMDEIEDEGIVSWKIKNCLRRQLMDTSGYRYYLPLGYGLWHSTLDILCGTP